MNRYYYIFGQEASSAYYDAENFESFLEEVKEGIEVCTYMHDDSCQGPNDLIEAYDGWNGYANIEEGEYLQIEEVLKEREVNNES